MYFVLVSVASAHMYLSSPSPQFEAAFQYDMAAPSSICDLAPYSVGGPLDNIATFNGGVSANYPNLRAFADACATATNTKSCGNTIRDSVVARPFEDIIRVQIGADHIGPSEIWIDDNLVMSNSGEENGNVKKTPRETKVDFAKYCQGKCVVRFVMAGLHVSPAEIFDNCVTVSMGDVRAAGNVNEEAPVPVPEAPVPETETPVPEAPVPEPVSEQLPSLPETVQKPKCKAPDVMVTTYPASASPAPSNSEWSCNGDTLVRTVGSEVYNLECPAGTKCTTTGVPYAMCNHA